MTATKHRKVKEQRYRVAIYFRHRGGSVADWAMPGPAKPDMTIWEVAQARELLVGASVENPGCDYMMVVQKLEYK